jgi:hypothetical protein
MKGTGAFKLLLGVLILSLALCGGLGGFVVFQSQRTNERIRNDSVAFITSALTNISSHWDLDRSTDYLNAEIPQGKDREVWKKRFGTYSREFGKLKSVGSPKNWYSRTESGPEGDTLMSEIQIPVQFERANALVLCRMSLRREDRRRFETLEIVRQ